MRTRRTIVVGVLLLTLVASLVVGLTVKNFAPVANAAGNSTPARYSLVIFLDGVLPSMITPQTAPFITSLAQTGVHYTNAYTAVPADSLTDITADLTGTFATQSGIPYELFYDRHYNQVIELDETPILPPGFTLDNVGNLMHAETIFQAAKAAGLRTEFIAKLHAYSIENGPKSLGPSPSIDILHTPTFANFKGTPQQYDKLNFEFLRNDILSGSNRPNLFAIYAVAPNSIEKAFGINAPEVAQVISFEDHQIQLTVDALKQAGIYNQTDIFVTADHGNTAVNTAIPDSGPGSIQQFLDDHGIPVIQATADQVYLVWLQNQSQTREAINLLSPASVKKRFGIDYILTQGALKNMNAAPVARTPDFAIQPTIGNNGTPAVVYTSPPLTKHVEHGGFNSSDTHVPLFVSGPGVKQGIIENEHVYPVQIAPTVAHNMCLSLKTAVLAPLVDAASSQISCNNAHAQNTIKSSGLPLAVPLFGVIPMTFWLFRRDKNMEVA